MAETFNIVIPYVWLKLQFNTANADLDVDVEPYYRDMLDAGCTLSGKELADDKHIVHMRNSSGRLIDFVKARISNAAMKIGLEDMLRREAWLRPEKPGGDYLESKAIDIRAACEAGCTEAMREERDKMIGEMLDDACKKANMADFARLLCEVQPMMKYNGGQSG